MFPNFWLILGIIDLTAFVSMLFAIAGEDDVTD